MALKYPLKMLAKGTKNMKLFAIFGGFEGLNISSYQISKASFQQATYP